MPTDLDAVSRRKKREAQDDAQTTITKMSVYVIIYLGLALLLLKVVGA